MRVRRASDLFTSATCSLLISSPGETYHIGLTLHSELARVLGSSDGHRRVISIPSITMSAGKGAGAALAGSGASGSLGITSKSSLWRLAMSSMMKLVMRRSGLKRRAITESGLAISFMLAPAMPKLKTVTRSISNAVSNSVSALSLRCRTSGHGISLLTLAVSESPTIATRNSAGTLVGS